MPEAFVEKDYWITEILRTIATTLGERAIFKGGTSLSKGWDLLDRFSEDIDLFVDPAVEPPLRNERAINRAMKRLNRDVAAIPGLDFVRADSKTIGGRGRIDTFLYRSHFPEVEGFPPTVRLEPGIQSGKQPTTTVEISSIVGRLLSTQGAADELDVEGLQPFEMTLLHFRRTFVEKLSPSTARSSSSRKMMPRWAATYATTQTSTSSPADPRSPRCWRRTSTTRSRPTMTRRAAPSSRAAPPSPGLHFTTSDALFPSDELRVAIEPGCEEDAAASSSVPIRVWRGT